MHIISVNCLIEKIPIVGWEFWSEQWIWNPVSPVGATGEWPGDTLDSDKWLFPPPFILFTIQRLSLNKTLFLLSMLLAVVSKWANLLKDSSWKDLKYNKNKRLIAACFFFFPGKNQILQKRTEIHSKAFQYLPLHQNSCDTSQSLGQQGNPSIYFHSRFLFAYSVWKQLIMTQIKESKEQELNVLLL